MHGSCCCSVQHPKPVTFSLLSIPNNSQFPLHLSGKWSVCRGAPPHDSLFVKLGGHTPKDTAAPSASGGSHLGVVVPRNCTTLWPMLDSTDRALVRSQMASIPFHTPPVSAASRFDPPCFTVLLLRRFWTRFWWPWYPVESGAARICREAGASVSDNIRVREQTTVVWKLSPTVCFSTAHSLPWTPRCTVRVVGARRRQCAERDGAAVDQPVAPKSAPTQTDGRTRKGSIRGVLHARQEEDGQRSPTHSSDSWPERGPGRSFVSASCSKKGVVQAVVHCFGVFPLRRSRSLSERRGSLGSDGALLSTFDVIWDDRLGGCSEQAPTAFENFSHTSTQR